MTNRAARRQRQRSNGVVRQRDAYPKGTVLIPCADLARYHHFTHDLTMLDVPDGTEISMFRSSSIVQNMNQMVKNLSADSAWVWVIGDDHTFERDTVLRLLAHDVDVVAPLCTRRGPPFSLVAFDEERGLDEFGRPLYHMQQLDDTLPEHGLYEVVSAGTAGMLIKREVLDAIGEPWFENSDTITTNEDMVFCQKVRAAGYKVQVDVDTRIGHIGVVVIRPDFRDQWGITLDFQGEGRNDIFIAGGIRPNDQGAPDTRTGTLDW